MTNEQKQKVIDYILENYKNKTAPEIANILNISVSTVYRIKTKFKLNNSLNPIFKLNKEQEQIILGGILGDGNIKPNGINCYYRECHSVLEEDYLIWKYNKLYDITTQKIYDIPARTENQNPQKSFQTKNSSIFNYYKSLTLDEVIEKIDELGLIIFFLDDGWISKKNYKGNLISCNFGLATGILNEKQTELIINKFKEKMNISWHLTGHKEKEFHLNSEDNEKFVNIVLKYFDLNMDIIKKKIYPYLISKKRVKDSPIPLQ